MAGAEWLTLNHVSNCEQVKQREPSGAHVDIWHLMRGRKSTIKNKWIGRKSKEPIRNGHVASEMTSHLTTIFSQPIWGEGKRGRDRERRRRRVF